jgi:hypothetical protein
MVVSPTEAIRDYAEHVISGDRRAMCSEAAKKNLEEWAKNDEYRKAIMGVLKARLELPWPYNYKALDILACMPAAEVADCLALVTKLHESAGAVEGAQHLKAISKGLVEGGKKEKDRVEEEEAKKRMAAVAEMWGGLWTNQPGAATGQQVMHQQNGWGGWPYPYRTMPPGVAAPGAGMAPGPEWQGKAPEGWTPWVIAPVPIVSSGGGLAHGFPRQA